ncbi:hypothetical protein SAMD00019534_015560, partial [Acytostelium subglobosum LB1]|uniref:hypothetical protein n=1 Tax=Acytostelium subglobosum LB1 TaxID=1410327 RepID=UPI000644D6DE
MPSWRLWMQLDSLGIVVEHGVLALSCSRPEAQRHSSDLPLLRKNLARVSPTRGQQPLLARALAGLSLLHIPQRVDNSVDPTYVAQVHRFLDGVQTLVFDILHASMELETLGPIFVRSLTTLHLHTSSYYDSYITARDYAQFIPLCPRLERFTVWAGARPDEPTAVLNALIDGFLTPYDRGGDSNNIHHDGLTRRLTSLSIKELSMADLVQGCSQLFGALVNFGNLETLKLEMYEAQDNHLPSGDLDPSQLFTLLLGYLQAPTTKIHSLNLHVGHFGPENPLLPYLFGPSCKIQRLSIRTFVANVPLLTRRLQQLKFRWTVSDEESYVNQLTPEQMDDLYDGRSNGDSQICRGLLDSVSFVHRLELMVLRSMFTSCCVLASLVKSSSQLPKRISVRLGASEMSRWMKTLSDAIQQNTSLRALYISVVQDHSELPDLSALQSIIDHHPTILNKDNCIIVE